MKPDDYDYDICRTSLVQAFEFTLEESGKLLKRCLFKYSGSKQKLDALTFKDRFREAYLHGLLSKEETERWMQYRDIRNLTAHSYNEENIVDIISCMNSFIKDVEKLMGIFNHE